MDATWQTSDGNWSATCRIAESSGEIRCPFSAAAGDRVCCRAFCVSARETRTRCAGVTRPPISDGRGLTVSTVGGSHQKVDVMEPREDELACIAIERPETSCLVDVDVEARCFLEFFSDALNQFREAESSRSQDTHVPRTPVLRQTKTNGIGWSKAVAAPAPERIASNARIYNELIGGLTESRCFGVPVDCPHARILLLGAHQADSPERPRATTLSNSAHRTCSGAPARRVSVLVQRDHRKRGRFRRIQRKTPWNAC